MLVGVIIKFKGAMIAKGNWGVIEQNDEMSRRKSEMEASQRAAEEGSSGHEE